jgi:hypothetical protein
MLPKYIIFSGYTYYPSGGWKEFYSYAETLEEAYSIYGEALKIGSKNRGDCNGPFDNDIKSDRPMYYKREWVQIVCARTNVTIKDNTEDIYIL